MMQSVSSIFTERSEESDFMPDFEEDTKPFCCAKSGDRVFHPKDKAIRLWQTVLTVCCFLSSCLTTFVASFSSEITWMWVMLYIFDVIYVADIVLNFFIMYYNHIGILVNDHRKIVKRYLRTRFWYDVLAILPVDLCALIWPGTSPMRTLSRLRLNRLLQFYRVISFFVAREAELGSKTALIRGIKYSAVSAWVTHVITCTWHTLACDGHHAGLTVHCQPHSWANNTHFSLDIDISNATAYQAYIESLYWAVATVTSTGYGDVRAVSVSEKWFSVFAMLAGIGVFFGMLLGGLTSMLTNFDEQRGSYVHRFNVIKANLNDQDCAEDLRTQVVGYYEYLWVRKRGVLTGDAYHALPLTFKAEISHTTFNSILRKAHMFDGCGSGFLRMLSLNIKPSLFLPRQIIINKGDVGHQMFFVHKGEVEVLSEDDEATPVATLKSGKLFGEISLIYSLPRTATIRAATHCDLMVLEKKDLQTVLLQYPDIGKRLLEVAKQRCNSADTIARKDSLHSHGSNVTIGNTPKAFQQRRSSILEAPPRSLRKSFAPTAAILEEEEHELEAAGSLASLPRSGAYPSAAQRRRMSVTHDALHSGVPTIPSRRISSGTSAASDVSNSAGSVFQRRKSSKRHSIVISKSLEIIEDVETEDLSTLTFWRRMRARLQLLVEWIDSLTIPPNSGMIRFWQKLVVIISIVVSFIYPYMACFTAYDQRAGYNDSRLGTALLALSYVCDVILVADIFINLRTGIATPHGTKTSFREIVDNYCYSLNFVYDVIAALPLELFCLLVTSDPVARWRLFAFLKLNRVVKVMQLPQEFDKEEELMEVSVLKERSLKLLVYVTLLSHWAACVLYVISCYGSSCNDESWMPHWVRTSRGHDVDALRPHDEYIAALYWATATMTSTGYGDIHAHSTQEQMTSLLFMMLGLLLYGYCLAALAATLANLDAPRVRFLEKIIAIKDFMVQRDLNPRLQQAVTAQLKIIWHKYGGVWMPGQTPLMADLPHALQQDIAMEDLCWILNKVPLFTELDDSFLRMLSLKLVPYTFCPGQHIVYAGDLGREMYMIRRGVCQYRSAERNTVIADIGQGQYFGDLPMLFGDYHLASVCAKTHVEVLELKMSDLWDTLTDFPLIKSQFEEVVHDKARQKRVRQNILSKIKLIEDREPCESGDCKPDSSFGLRRRHTPNLGVKTFSPRLESGAPNRDYTQPFSEMSRVQRLASRMLLRHSFLPGGLVMTTWQRVLMCMAIVLAFTLPFQLAFMHTVPWLWLFHYVVDLVAAVCLYLGFHMSFYNLDGVLVTHPLSTACNYLRSTFLIDFMSCFPFELFVLAARPEMNHEDLHLAAFMRLTRLLHTYRIPLVFQRAESSIEKPSDHVRALKFLIYIAMFMNVLTCGLFMVACPPNVLGLRGGNATLFDTATGHRCLVDSWIDHAKLNTSQASLMQLYSVSFYFASATSVSVGYGDIAPHFDHEMVMALCFMTAGVLFFGYIIASIAANLANADTQRANFQEKLNAIKRFLQDQQIWGALQDKVIAYYEYVWRRTRGVNPERLFDGMPQSLWGDVTYNLYGDILGKMSMTKDADKSFIKMLSKCVKPVMFRGGDYILRKHDMGSEVYFIHQGQVEVVSEGGHMVFDVLNEGSSFGEDGWLFASPRSASVRAKTNCDLFMLTKDSLDFVLESYPDIRIKITRRAEDERKKARKMSEAAQKLRQEKRAKHAEQQRRHSRKHSSDAVMPPHIDPELRTLDEAFELTAPSSHRDFTPIVDDEEIFDSFLFPRSLKGHHRRISAQADDLQIPSPSQLLAKAASDEHGSAEENSDQSAGEADTQHSSSDDNNETSTQHNANLNNSFIAKGPASHEQISTMTPSEASLHAHMLHGSVQDSVSDSNASDVTVRQGLLGRLATCTILPSNLYYRRFCDLMCVLGFVSCWLLIYQAAFQQHQASLYAIQYVIDLMYLLSIFLKFRLSFYNHQGNLTVERRRIRERYVHSWLGFPLDAFTALPLDPFAFIAPPGSRLMALSFLRLNHLLRYVRVSQYFSKWETELNIRVLLVRSCKFTVIFVLVIHIFSCVWYVTACPLGECQPDTWAAQISFENTLDAYGTCIYWCIATMTSTGYGDICGETVREMWIASLVMMAGKLLFGLILANIASTLAHAEALRVQYDSKLLSVKSHMADQEVPRLIQQRVIDYYNYLWMRSRGQDVQSLFLDAPYCLRAEIYLAVTRDMLTHIPLFEGVEESFLRHVCQKVQQLWFLPGDYIVMKGDMGREMYYIHRGEVEVVSDEPHGADSDDSLLGPGDIFGEVSLVCSVPRRVTVRARTHVDLFTLSKQHLDAALTYYPAVRRVIGERAKIRFGYIMEQMRKMGARRMSYL